MPDQLIIFFLPYENVYVGLLNTFEFANSS